MTSNEPYRTHSHLQWQSSSTSETDLRSPWDVKITTVLHLCLTLQLKWNNIFIVIIHINLAVKINITIADAVIIVINCCICFYWWLNCWQPCFILHVWSSTRTSTSIVDNILCVRCIYINNVNVLRRMWS